MHEMLNGINERISMGALISDVEKGETVKLITDALGYDVLEKIDSLTSKDLESMYPLFITAKSKGKKKERLITGELPKTKILADNSYELEVLRLLALWGERTPEVNAVLLTTERRIKNTCFGVFCEKGECPGASIASLRFYTAIRPDDLTLQSMIVDKLKNHRDSNGKWNLDIPYFYLMLALTNCDYSVVEDELNYAAIDLVKSVAKPWLVEPFQLIRKYVVRNSLALIPKYAYLKDRTYYEKDGRWHLSDV
jgi:hypothetical protein